MFNALIYQVMSKDHCELPKANMPLNTMTFNMVGSKNMGDISCDDAERDNSISVSSKNIKVWPTQKSALLDAPILRQTKLCIACKFVDSSQN